MRMHKTAYTTVQYLGQSLSLICCSQYRVMTPHLKTHKQTKSAAAIDMHLDDLILKKATKCRLSWAGTK